MRLLRTIGIDRGLAFAGLAVLSLASAPAIAQRAAGPVAASLQVQGATADDGVVLNPGQYLWYADLTQSSAAPVSIVISIPSQLAYVYRDGALIGVSTVSTGRPGKATPTGSFTILEKQIFHRSNKYSNAPMPWMERLTWDGVAMHAGQLPGYPASHGCIRLPLAFARALYGITLVGAQVSVIDAELTDPTYDPTHAPPAPLLRADVAGLGGESFNVVTMGGTPPALAPATSSPQPVRFGPLSPVVQPLPGAAR